MTPQECIDWADLIDRRLGAISGRQADGLALFLRRAARALDNALDDKRRLDWLEHAYDSVGITFGLPHTPRPLCVGKGETLRAAIDATIRSEGQAVANRNESL